MQGLRLQVAHLRASLTSRSPLNVWWSAPDLECAIIWAARHTSPTASGTVRASRTWEYTRFLRCKEGPTARQCPHIWLLPDWAPANAPLNRSYHAFLLWQVLHATHEHVQCNSEPLNSATFFEVFRIYGGDTFVSCWREAASMAASAVAALLPCLSRTICMHTSCRSRRFSSSMLARHKCSCSAAASWTAAASAELKSLMRDLQSWAGQGYLKNSELRVPKENRCRTHKQAHFNNIISLESIGPRSCTTTAVLCQPAGAQFIT